MARMTKAQREWRPGQRKKQRSIKVMFTSMILSLEALVAFFATLATFGHNFNAATGFKVTIWVLGLGLVAALIANCAFLHKSWGYTVGWVLQILLILWGFLLPWMFFIGAAFALCYWYSLHAGSRLDRENRQREQEQIAWEKKHGM